MLSALRLRLYDVSLVPLKQGISSLLTNAPAMEIVIREAHRL